MDISERIKNLKPYFLSFNVMAEDDASYVLMHFPDNWVLPDAKMLKDVYLTEIAPRESGIFFLTEIENGTDKLFDCVEFVVKYNKNIEERKYLLSEKIKELTKLFASAELEQLKSLKFVMDEVSQDQTEPKKTKGKGKKAENKTPEQKVEDILTEVAEKSGTVDVTENNKAEDTVQEPDSDENGLMALAKSLTGGE